MIVKDSGSEFGAILREIKPFIDRWTILDTGSSDDTRDVVRKSLEGIPGRLYESPFVDFSTSRNEALSKASGECAFILMLDDSYVFKDGEEFRKELTRYIDVMRLNAFTIRICAKDQEYDAVRLIRTGSGLVYVGKIHEVIDVDPTGPTVANIASPLLDRTSNYLTHRTRNRGRSDEMLMLEHLADNPRDRRIRMHLVRMYAASFEPEDALKAKKHIGIMLSEDHTDIYHLDCSLLEMQLSHMLGSARQWTKNDYLNLCKLSVSFPDDVRIEYNMCLAARDLGHMKKAFSHIAKAAAVSDRCAVGGYVDPKIIQLEIPYQLADLALHTGRPIVAEKILKTKFEETRDNRLFNIILNATNYPQPDPQLLGAPVVVIHATTTVKGWSPVNFRGVSSNFGSGSEIMASGLAVSLTNLGYRVFVFGAFVGPGYDTEGVYDGVQFVDHSKYIEFLLKYKTNHLVVSRDTNNIIYAANVQNVYLWVHDILPMSHVGASLQSIQTHPSKFNTCLALCEWHKDKISDATSLPPERISITRNAIRTDLIKLPEIGPLRPRFIYASSLDRGLEHLLRLFRDIRNRCPEATLDVYTDVERSVSNYKGNTDEIIMLLDEVDGVFVRGRVPHSELMRVLPDYGIWFYPTDFCETYCILAVECQAAGLLCVTTAIGSLPEIVSDRGFHRGKVTSPEDTAGLVDLVCRNIEDPFLSIPIRQKAQNWARCQRFDTLASEWKREIFRE